MSRVWFETELETVATWWRVYRRDGVAFGFTSHDHDLMFDDIRHQTASGMVPSAVRLTADLAPDSAEVTGALSHHAVTARDLAAGRFDGARVELGVVDWETLEKQILYAGTIGTVTQDGPQYSAELASLKNELSKDRIPRTSPTCRAGFCEPGCNLSPARYTHDASIAAVSLAENALEIAGAIVAEKFLDGFVRFYDGIEAGREARIAAISDGRFVLDRIFDETVAEGDRVELREGCDHRWETCANRFGNSVNFRGEPFLPGNDLLTRYPTQP